MVTFWYRLNLSLLLHVFALFLRLWFQKLVQKAMHAWCGTVRLWMAANAGWEGEHIQTFTIECFSVQIGKSQLHLSFSKAHKGFKPSKLIYQLDSMEATTRFMFLRCTSTTLQATSALDGPSKFIGVLYSNEANPEPKNHHFTSTWPSLIGKSQGGGPNPQTNQSSSHKLEVGFGQDVFPSQ